MRTGAGATLLDQMDDSESRMIKANSSALLDTFKNSVSKFSEIQSRYKKQIEKAVKRQITIVDEDLDPEEIDELVQDQEKVQKLIQKKMVGTAHFTLVNAVKDIKEKYEDIIQLEQNISQITFILKEIGAMIHENGEYVDSLRSKIHNAKDLTNKGKQNLDDAEGHLKSANKKQGYLCCCLSMVGVVVFCPLILTVLQNTSII